MRREYRLTEIVKQYDPALFVKADETGKMHLIRKQTRFEPVEIDGMTVLFSRPDYQQVFSLTENWLPKGRAVDVGIEPLMARLREIDGHRSEEILDRVNHAYEQSAETRKRDLKNLTTDFAYEFRDAVKHDFADYNLASHKTKDTEELFKYKIEKEGL